MVVVGPDPTRYHLEDVTLLLDGTPVRAATGTESGPLAQGRAVPDGDHVVTARLVYRGQPLGPRPWEEGARWTLPAKVTVQARHGLRFIVRLSVDTNEKAPAGQRLSLQSDVEPVMLVAVDDAPLPPPPVPHLAPPPEVAAAPCKGGGRGERRPLLPPRRRRRRRRPGRPARPRLPTTLSATAPAAAAADPLAEATSRLKSALAAPADGGTAPGGEAQH